MPLPNVHLTEEQREWLIERVEDHIDDTEDWGLERGEYSAAIQGWIDILAALGAHERVHHWVTEYDPEFCDLTFPDIADVED